MATSSNLVDEMTEWLNNRVGIDQHDDCADWSRHAFRLVEEEQCLPEEALEFYDVKTRELSESDEFPVPATWDEDMKQHRPRLIDLDAARNKVDALYGNFSDIR